MRGALRVPQWSQERMVLRALPPRWVFRVEVIEALDLGDGVMDVAGAVVLPGGFGELVESCSCAGGVVGVLPVLAFTLGNT